MTLAETKDDAKKYADMIHEPVYIYQRGAKFTASKRAIYPGWKRIDTITPTPFNQ